jgi:hypothetical protein
VRQPFNGIAVDLTSCSRFLDRIERHPGGWLIAERAAIYERDRLDPVEPSPAFDELFKAANTSRNIRSITGTWLSVSPMPRRPLAGAGDLPRPRAGDHGPLCTFFRLACRQVLLTALWPAR